MKTVLRTGLGAMAIGLCTLGALCAVSAPATAGVCLSPARSVATLIDPSLACTAADPTWTARAAVKPPMPATLKLGAVTQPETRAFARMLLASIAQMSDFRIDYTIQEEAPTTSRPGGSVIQEDGVMTLVSAPTVLGRSFMLDLGLLVPDSAASGANPWVTADVGGVNTLTRPKESTWRRPNDNSLFSDLFGEPVTEDAKTPKRP